MIIAIQSEGYTCFPIRSINSMKLSIRKSYRERSTHRETPREAAWEQRVCDSGPLLKAREADFGETSVSKQDLERNQPKKSQPPLYPSGPPPPPKPVPQIHD